MTSAGAARPEAAAPARPGSEPDGKGAGGRAAGFDFALLAVTLAAAGFGLVMILSASSQVADAGYGDTYHFVARQLVGLGLGAAGAAVVVAAPYAWLRRGAWPLYLATLALLLLVLTPVGHSANGAARWIGVGPIHVQPSEIARLALVLILADYLANNRGRLADVVGVGIPALGLVLPPVVIAIFQRDFGTTAILIGLTGVMLFVAGLQWRWLAVGGAVAGTLLAFLVVIEPYRMRRMVGFTDPFADPSGSGYQVVQGWVALATGGLFGTGLATGVAQRGFLPEAHTDFISAVVGEELGALGWCALVALQMALVWRASAIAVRAPDLFGMVAATGIAAMFGASACINLGVVCGLLPAKGLVLPFVSYGASAAVVHTAAIGVVLKIGTEGARLQAQLAPQQPGGR
jgi:cell division protein FtsW